MSGPVGWADVATKRDLSTGLNALRLELHGEIQGLRAEMERLARRLIMWTASMVLATGALAFAAGRFV